MNKCLLIILVIAVVFSARAQDNSGKPAEKNRRFFVGASYTFMSVDMNLTALTLHSAWFGSDAGTEVKTQEQIDEINSFVDRYSRVNAVFIQLGMTFLEKPGVK